MPAPSFKLRKSGRIITTGFNRRMFGSQGFMENEDEDHSDVIVLSLKLPNAKKNCWGYWEMNIAS
jgi:hypothetical protein